MSEYAPTTLSITPVHGTWQEVLQRLEIYLRDQHKPPAVLPRKAKLLTVNADERRVDRLRPIDLWQPIDPESEGIEFWRSVTVEAWFDTVSDFVHFCIREIDRELTAVELWFPTRVHEGVFCYDLAQRDFDPVAKSELIRMFIAVTKAVGAAGFGYRRAKEDSLFGPLTVEFLRDYVEVGSRWFEKRHKLQLKVAGLATSYVEDTQFEYHISYQPMYYRREGFYIFDILWPR